MAADEASAIAAADAALKAICTSLASTPRSCDLAGRGHDVEHTSSSTEIREQTPQHQAGPH